MVGIEADHPIGTLLEDRLGEALRSVLAYDEDDYTVLYVRPDVEDDYAPDDLEAVVQHHQMDAFGRPVLNDLFSADHGELLCQVAAFEDVVEVNVTVGEFSGIAIAFDAVDLDDLHGFIAELRQLVDAHPPRSFTGREDEDSTEEWCPS